MFEMNKFVVVSFIDKPNMEFPWTQFCKITNLGKEILHSGLSILLKMHDFIWSSGGPTDQFFDLLGCNTQQFKNISIKIDCFYIIVKTQKHCIQTSQMKDRQPRWQALTLWLQSLSDSVVQCGLTKKVVGLILGCVYVASLHTRPVVNSELVFRCECERLFVSMLSCNPSTQH